MAEVQEQRTVFLVETGERDYEHIAGAYLTLAAAMRAVETVAAKWTKAAWGWREWEYGRIYTQESLPYYEQEHSAFMVFAVGLDCAIESGDETI